MWRNAKNEVNYPQMHEVTTLVTVLRQPTLIPVGIYKQKRHQFELRDVSKLKRANQEGWRDEGDDSDSYTYDEETHTWKRKSKEMATDEYDDYEFSDSERFSMGGGENDDPNSSFGDGASGAGGAGKGSSTRMTAAELCDELYALKGETEDERRERNMTLQFMTELEKEEKNKWIASVLSLLNPPKELSKCQFGREMEVFAKRQLKKMIRSGTTPWLRTVIVGPKGGGKTTFMAVFIRVLVETLGELGAWRQTVFFVLDFNWIEQEVKTHIDLYKYIVGATFNQLQKQYPKIKPYAQKMADYFCGLADGTSGKTFPKSIRVDSLIPYIDVQLNKLIRKIRKLIDDENVPGLIRCTMNFPQDIAKLFLFKNIFITCDHFEQSDISVIDSRDKQFNILEELKAVLKVLPFIVCCREEERLIQSLRALEEGGTSIDDKVTFINIARIKLRKRHLKDDLLIQFARGYDPVRIQREQCGGCIAFLAEWTSIVKLATHASNFELRQGKLTKGQKSDDHAACIDRIRTFLPKIMDVSTLPPSSITGVKLVKGRV